MGNRPREAARLRDLTGKEAENACEDQGDVGDPEPLVILERFNLQSALQTMPDAWVVFDRDNSVLHLEHVESETEARHG